MLRLSRRRLLIAAVSVAALALLAVAVSAEHSWGNYHWARTSNPFTLKVGDNVSAAWDAYLDEAISDWSQSSVLDLAEVAGGTSPKSCRPTAGRIEVCNARYGNTGWLGIAQIWASGSHITQAISKMNDTYFDTSTYNTPAWRRLVMCQEIAHDFGLDHQDENFNNANLGSCMDYTNDPDGGAGGAVNNDPSNEHPNSHDFEQIQIIYGHLDGTTTIGMTVDNAHNPAAGEAPPAFYSLQLDGPGQWGREIRRSANGRVSLYELDFGNGHKIFTHVFWVSGEERGRSQERHDDEHQ